MIPIIKKDDENKTKVMLKTLQLSKLDCSTTSCKIYDNTLFFKLVYFELNKILYCKF